MKILITGSSGYVGQHLLNYLISKAGEIEFPGSEDVTVIAAYHSFPKFDDILLGPIRVPIPPATPGNDGIAPTTNININRMLFVTKVGNVNLADASSMAKLASQHGPPDLLIHLATISSLVECESRPDYAMAVNCPTETLLSQLPHSCRVIFLSTDQIYNGINAPYFEDDITEENPVNTYGKTKLAFERALLSKCCSQRRTVVCLRSSLILGPPTPWPCRKQSFVQFALEALLAKDKTTDIFTDEYRSVIYVQDVIRTILWFAFTPTIPDGTTTTTVSTTDRITGCYNMGGPERVSRWDIIQELAQALQLDDTNMSHIVPTQRSSLPETVVQSPPDISMDITKLCSITGLQMTPLKDIIRLCLDSQDY